MGNNLSRQTANASRRSSSIRSRISSKRWSTSYNSGLTVKNPTVDHQSLDPEPDITQTENLESFTGSSDSSSSDSRKNNGSLKVFKDTTTNINSELQDAEYLIKQLEALLEDPGKFSTHRKIIARLTNRVSNVLEGNCLLNQLQELIEEPQKFSKYEKELTNLTRRASTIFENSYQTYHRIAYSGLPLIICRIAQDFNLLETLVINKEKVFGASDLAEITGINKDVLELFLEYMAAQHLVEDAGDFFYRANNVTINLLDPIAVHGIPVFDDLLFPIIGCLGDSLKDLPGRNAHQIAFNTSLDLGSWLENDPELHKRVYELIQHQWNISPSWHSVVDFQEEFAHDSDEQSFVFVDVCGGSGNQCTSLLEKCPNLKGRVILQDRLARLKLARVPDRVKKVPYELFSDQHIRGAYVYYFRQVLHQNTDEAVVRILKAQVPAMRKNSVLLIDEKVLPDIKIPQTTSLLNVAELNILMVACFNAFERRQSHWLRLIDEAGYDVTQIHPYSDLQDCIIVAKVKSGLITQESYDMDQKFDIFNSLNEGAI